MATENSYKNLTDKELVQKIVKGNDPVLFGRLYDRYVTVVYNKCHGFSKSQDEAEDLTQDVFLMLFIKLRTYKGNAEFSTWLYSFTYNFCVNYVNRDKERSMRDKTGTIDKKENTLSVEVSDDSLLQLKVGKLKKALELISPEDKSILLLKYQDGVSIKELEELLKIGQSAVKMRLKRAKTKIIEAYNKLS